MSGVLMGKATYWLITISQTCSRTFLNVIGLGTIAKVEANMIGYY